MKHPLSLYRSQRGAALLILFMLILLVGSAILLKGLSGKKPGAQQREASLAQLAEAKEALIGFAMATGRLPCPADPVIATGAANAGLERPACTLAADRTGVLPWVTLGIGETDAWGRRFSYSVTPAFADNPSTTATFIPPATCIPAPNPTQSSFALCSDGDITILDTAGGATMADKIPALILSHGKNGFNAVLGTGVQISPSTDADENENNMGNANFVSKTISETFDDVVVWIELQKLKDMMQKAQKLP
ncbi:MAG: hypothetical protein A2511_01140 [Deltaproteobacteria bacterium RIFOXYD12_FULL_50_9]|nr:MAG: hypothetical protein A2511_01140 [Deltaproteobacteria bacterium RIFOXYD12_FULL_50_9]